MKITWENPSSLGAFVTQWGYTTEGLLSSMQYPDGETLTYGYHPQGAFNSLSSSLGDSLVYSSAYDAAGRITLRKLGGASALQTANTYFAWNTPNGAGRLKRIAAGTTSLPTSLLDLRYYSGTDTPKYDAVGNLLNIYNLTPGASEQQIFTYDTLDRLTHAEAYEGGSDYSEYYTYDPDTGNLESKTVLGTYTYLDGAHAHAVTHLDGAQKYWYDPNGNQTKRILGSDTYDLKYDAENRLVEVRKNNALIATFVYNGDGQRVIQTLNGTTTVFIGEYYQKTGTSVIKYYTAGAQQVAVRSSNGLRYVFADHLGSSTVTADVNGGSVQRQLYKAFGETRSTTMVATEYAYSGQYAYDSVNELGLLFYRSRYYDNALGRFISADSIVPNAGDPQSFDRYAFVRSNPVNRVDPSGHADICLECGDGGRMSDAERLARLRISRFQGTLVSGRAQPTIAASTLFDNTANSVSIPALGLVQATPTPFPQFFIHAASPMPTPLPTPIPTTCAVPPSVNYSWTLDRASDLTSIGPVVNKGINGAKPSGSLLLAGGVFAALAQWERDEGLNITSLQRLGRSSIVGGISMLVSTTSSAIAVGPAAGGFTLGPITGGVTFAAVYGTTYAAINSNIDYQLIFDNMGLNP